MAVRKTKKSTGQFYSGTSGLTLPPGGKTTFPPEYQDRSRLCYYASLFNSVEINSSFYKIPMERTIRRWVEETPEEFRFTFKLFKEITHNKALSVDEDLVRKFMQVIDDAGDKKGCLLIQFPPSVIYNRAYLKRLLAVIEQYDPAHGWNPCVEFRHNSWYRDETYELLSEYGASIVMQDIPKSVTPIIDPWGGFVYLRFHGPTGNYRGGYSNDAMADYAWLIKDWMEAGTTVYAYFNNTMGDAVQNLTTLNGFVAGNDM